MDKDRILQSLECPICHDYMGPPIRQCITGHSLCNKCYSKMEICGLCKGEFTTTRNITLESIAMDLQYPCINQRSGCRASLAYNEREAHESNCPLRPISCAVCPWTGSIDFLEMHWNSKFPAKEIFRVPRFCQLQITPQFDFITLVISHGKLFWFKCQIKKKKMFWIVQLIGDHKTPATNYFYQIELIDVNKKKRLIRLQDYCQSLNCDESLLYSGGGAISISKELLDTFTFKGEIHFNFRLYVDGDETAGVEGACARLADIKFPQNWSKSNNKLHPNPKQLQHQPQPIRQPNPNHQNHTRKPAFKSTKEK